MIPLYTQLEYSQARNLDLLPLECKQCHRKYLRPKKNIKSSFKTNRAMDFCSMRCVGYSKNLSSIVNCKNCNLAFRKIASQIKRSKNHFCSSSCAAIYNNTHKTYGCRRSKLEMWLENKLKELYPDLEIHFNRKDTINSELDVYIPSLHLAFELNGIFHYEPIYGADKLAKIKNNDNRKFQACLEKNIELCIIDTSGLSYFKEKNCLPFLIIIQNIIENTKINSP